ncbi:MAG: PilZ domain-containing protein [Mariprofundaceae bacterium]
MWLLHIFKGAESVAYEERLKEKKMSDDAGFDNRRQDFRVDDVLPVRDEPLSVEQYALEKNRIGIRSRQGSRLRDMVGGDLFAGDSALAQTESAQALQMLDAKLNYLIGVNMLNDASQSSLEERPVNLSATGIRLMTREVYQAGDPIKVTIMMPDFPPTTLELVGEVKRLYDMPNGTKQAGVVFYFRCEEEEDSIAKYVFKRQREMIRMKHREEEV